MTVTAFTGESLLSLYRNSYTVTAIFLFYGIAVLRHNVCISMYFNVIVFPFRQFFHKSLKGYLRLYS